MDIKEEKILGADAETHWYYVSKGRALRSLLRNAQVSEVLDVGAGSGIFSRLLLDAGFCKRAVCVDSGYAEEKTEIYNGREMVFVQSVDRISQGLILMIDVLEHVDDDVGLLRAYTSRMPDDSLALLAVPAFQFLWSGHDLFLEHRRRYTLAMVERLARESGLQVMRGRYFFASLFPAIATIRWWKKRRLDTGRAKATSDLKRFPPLVNAILTMVHDLERKLLFPFNRLAGLTVFCLARRA